MGAKTTIDIAKWVCRTNYNDNIDSDTIDYTKILALSQIGMTLAGSTMPFGNIVTAYIKDGQCPPEAGVIGTSIRTSTEYAALANASLSHTTELEDVSFPEAIYTCALFAPAFALAEKLHLSGKDVIEAFVVGFEVAARLSLSCLEAIANGWTNAPACGSIGAAATASKLLKLDVQKTTWALSLAASQAAGIGRQTGTGAHLVEAGFAGRNGICAALLAARGFTGDPTILEGPAGYCDLLAGHPEFDLQLGEGFRVMEVAIKKYPCCSLQQRNIDGVLDLINEYDISWEDVDTVEHGINHTLSLYLQYPQPTTGEHARFSLPHCTVACFFEDQVFLPSFTDIKAQDTRFVEARKKVNVTVHPEWERGFFTFNSPLTITMKNGTQYTKLCTSARGDAANKLSPDQVKTKYFDCVDFSGILSRERSEEAADIIYQLDDIVDLSELMSILTFPDTH